MAGFTPQEQHEFLKGVLERIQVRTLDKQAHEVVIRFNIPYLNDGLLWKRDARGRSLGYELVDGDYSVAIDIDTKKKTPEIVQMEAS